MTTSAASVVVVNWNGRPFLETCLLALSRQTLAGFECVVVDNGSTDGSDDWIQHSAPWVAVLANDDNVGFAEASNQGIAASSGKYIALLNNDAVPEPEWLEQLLQVAESDTSVGMVASQVTFAHDPAKLDSAGIEVDALGVAWNRHLGMPASDDGSGPVEVFGPSGSAALLRRRMVNEIGAFDARYFAYYEDVDLAWRAQRAGWRCLYAPKARVQHIHSASARRTPGFKAFHIGRNKWRTLFRHYPFARLASWVPLMLIVDMLSWGTQLARGNTSALGGRWQAWQERRTYWSERNRYGNPDRAAALLCRPTLTRYLRQSPW